MKQELIQLQKQVFKKASEILRTTKIEQHRGWFSNSLTGDGKKFCAMGAIYKEYGWDGKYDKSNFTKEDFSIITYELGLCDIPNSKNMVGQIGGDIIDMNDIDGDSFTEIADWLEERGL